MVLSRLSVSQRVSYRICVYKKRREVNLSLLTLHVRECVLHHKDCQMTILNILNHMVSFICYVTPSFFLRYHIYHLWNKETSD
jgi:hypothetical protein